jgi:hypothetical protein
MENLTDIEQADIIVAVGAFDQTLEILNARLENMYQTAGFV